MKHEYRIVKVKQYNSTYKHILLIDGEPVCITQSGNRISELLSYAQGYDVKIADGKIKKVLDKYRQ